MSSSSSAPQKCSICNKSAYVLESVVVSDKIYHKTCFKCVICKQPTTLSNFKSYDGQIFCPTHAPRTGARSPTFVPQNLPEISPRTKPPKHAAGDINANLNITDGAKNPPPDSYPTTSPYSSPLNRPIPVPPIPVNPNVVRTTPNVVVNDPHVNKPTPPTGSSNSAVKGKSKVDGARPPDVPKPTGKKNSKPRSIFDPPVSHEIQVLTDSQLIMDYEEVVPFTIGGALSALTDQNGKPQILTIGNDGHLYNVLEDPSSPTGWQVIDLNAPTTTTSMVATAKDLDGNNVIVIADKVAKTTVSYYKESRWTMGWRTFNDIGDLWNGLNLYTSPIGVMCAMEMEYYNPNGGWLHNVAFGITEGATTLCPPNLPLSTPLKVAVFYGLDTPLPPVIKLCYLPKRGAGSVVIYPGDSNSGVTFYPGIKHQNGDAIPLLGKDGLNDISTIAYPGNGGYSEIFVIHAADQSVCYLQPSPDYNSYTMVPLSYNVAQTKFVSVKGAVNMAGELSVFALGNDRALYHTYLVTETHMWEPMFPLLPGVVNYDVIQDTSSGASNLFAVTDTKTIIHMWETEDIGWQSEIIEVPSLTAIPIPVPCYTTLLTLTDLNTGSKLSNTPVSITTDDPMTLRIGPTEYFVDAEHPLSTTTDSAGQITVISIADGINLPALYVDYGSFEAHDRLMLEPNANAKDKIQNMSEADLVSAKSANGTPLLDKDWQPKAADAHATIQQLLLFQPDESAFALAHDVHPLHNRGKQKRGVRYVPYGFTMKSPPIDQAKVADQHWQVTFSPEPKFERLSAATVKQRIDDIVSTTEEGNVFDSWNDFWEGVKDAVVEVVTTVWSGASVLVNWIINGVHQFGTWVMKTVDDAISALEGFFEEIGATLKRWIEYLVVLFDWNDIWNSKTHIEALINQSLPNLRQVISSFGHNTNGVFSGLKSKVTDFFGNVQQYLPNDDSVGTVYDFQNDKPDSKLGEGEDSETFGEVTTPTTSSNWFYTKLNELGLTGGPSFFDDGLSQVLAQISQFLAALSSLKVLSDLQNLAGTFLNSLKQINLDNFMKEILSALISTAEQLILTALDGLDAFCNLFFGLIDALITAFQKMLNAPLGIPVIDMIYRYIICPEGQTEGLTMLHAISLLIAMPFTIFYKLGNNNKPPFPTSFKPPPVSHKSRVGVPPLPIPPDVLAYLQSTTTFWFTFFDTAIILFATLNKTGPPAPLPLWFLFTGLSLGVIRQTWSWPGTDSLPQELQLPTSLFWGASGMVPFLNLVWLCKSKGTMLARGDKVGVGALAAAGCCMLSMAVWKTFERSGGDTPANIVNTISDILPSFAAVINLLLMVTNAETVIYTGPIMLTTVALADVGGVIFPLVKYYKDY